MMGKIRNLAFTIFSFLSLSLLSACSDSSDGDINIASDFENSRTYFSTSTSVELEVVYEPDAAPLTEDTFGGGIPIWGITQANIEEVFSDRPLPVFVNVPTSLSQMTQVPTQNKTRWTVEDILQFTDDFRRNRSSAIQTYFFVAFVNGIFVNNDGVEQPSTIGLNVTGTPICFIFKDVVSAGSSGDNNALVAFLEQSTLVHELGHAFGYVNNGIPLASDHWDEENGAHCTNENCVMFWLNEGVRNLTQFVEQYMDSGSLILYGEECILDAREYLP
ncbi:hypothetical protein [Sediminitomix flava]|uniref:Dual-action HEIGH metallo-peptidase n=1 Tax=Sediminitomix flava TaxID=379075 RepID=A0A315Z5Q7_SEDFL|nr:hypothetical protein [Sediminitomix flava]PWJ39187.1 hypothetical protein BC781_10688 [Sediminitomix flava]